MYGEKRMSQVLRGYLPLMCLSALGLILVLADAPLAQQTQKYDPIVEVIPYRSVSEIAKEMDNANAAKQLAQNRRREAEERLSLLEPNIKTRVAQMDEIAAKRELAKRQKKTSEAVAYDAEIRATKSAISMIGRLKELRKAELDAARIQAEMAEQTVQTLQLEIELNKRRAERDSLANTGAGDVAIATATQVIYELEPKLLQAQKKLAEVNQEVSKREREIVSRRMRLYEAHAKLASPES